MPLTPEPDNLDDAGVVHTLGSQAGYLAYLLQISIGVPARLAFGARRLDQATPLVITQSVCLHAGQYGYDAD